MVEHVWGWYIVVYLFLAGAGAGAFVAAVCSDLLAPGWSKAVAKTGSLVSGPMVLIGTICLVLDLEAGLWEPWRQIYLVSNPTSMITWGVIILSAFIPVALLYAAAKNDISFIGPIAAKYTKPLAVIGTIFALGTAAYTGVLIAVVNGVPFWNSPLMPVLFLVSAMSTGISAVVLGVALWGKPMGPMVNVAGAHMVFVAVEIVVLMLFVFMSLTRSEAAAASAGILLSGSLSPYFWGLVVLVGLALPLVVSVVEFIRLGEFPTWAAVMTELCVLVGGVSLRAVIIFSATSPTIIT